jgi:hypothetical protein
LAAVRGGARDLRGGELAAGARLVVHHDVLAQRLRHVRGDQPCHQDGAATGRVRHHQRDRPATGDGVLRPREHGRGHGGPGGREHGAAGKRCGLLVHPGLLR